MVSTNPIQLFPSVLDATRKVFILLGVTFSLITAGCAAVSNPVAEGIPVRRLPPELLVESKLVEQPIPFTLLRQPPPEKYLLAPGDVLGIWIEGVMGEKTGIPPVVAGSRESDQSTSTLVTPVSLGYPVPVREDGTIPLPLIDPVMVEGLSIEEAQDAIIEAYTVKKKILQPGKERVIATLQRPRRYHILVVREDGGQYSFGASAGFGGFGGGSYASYSRKQSGFPLDLPAYENDLMNALTKTGGLPGYDAEREVLVEKGSERRKKNKKSSKELPEPTPVDKKDESAKTDADPKSQKGRIIRIPIRLKQGEEPSFTTRDITLEDGDIVYVQARPSEVFYTGGMIPSKAFPIPPYRDLDVVEAVLTTGGSVVNGGLLANNFNGNVQGNGRDPNPSLITVIRRTPGGGQIPIRVSLNRALQDPRERILIKNGDILILQDTMAEATLRYWNSRFRMDFFGRIINQRDMTADANALIP